MRSYTQQRMPAVVELAGGDALDASLELANAMERELGVSLHVEVDSDCLLLPSPFEVRRDGRALQGEEYETYAQACLAALSKLATRTIRFSVEELYLFDWEAFDARCWASLEAAYVAMPGWLDSKDLLCWFGYDERKGPHLSPSVEPPGLQVAGVLEPARFDDWHGRFLERTADLPVYKLR